MTMPGAAAWNLPYLVRWHLVLAVGALGCSSERTTGLSDRSEKQPVPASVELESTSLGLHVAEVGQLRSIVRDSLGATIAEPVLTWTTLNEGVAGVTGAGAGVGLVTAVGDGQAAIEVSTGALRASALVTVTDPRPGVERAWMDVDLVATNRFLWDVWGRSMSDVWFVGDSSEVLRFNGTFWEDHSPGFDETSFLAITGIGSTRWAVGGSSEGVAEIARSDGDTWTREDVGSEFRLFRDVWASSSRDVWAVGSNTDGEGAIAHFDGSDWRPVQLPLGTPTLRGVWGTGPGSVWFVGDHGTLLHYDGSGVAPESPGLTAAGLESVWGNGLDLVWAVGLEGTILERRNGTWSDVSPHLPVSNPFGNNLFGVWGTGESDLWAVGQAGTVLHFDGTSWSSVQAGSNFTMPGIWGSGPVLWAAGGFRGNVLVGVDPETFAPPRAEIGAVIPDSQAPVNMVTIHGGPFPVGRGAKNVRFRQGGTSALGFTFPTPDFASELLVRLPSDLIRGAATVEVVDAMGGPVTPPMALTILDEPAPPVVSEVYEMSWDESNRGCASLGSRIESDDVLALGSGGAVGVHAHGLDTVGGLIQLVQGDLTWTLPPYCPYWLLSGGAIAVISPLPSVDALSDQGEAGLAEGPARLRVSARGGPWSQGYDVTIVVS